MKGRVSVKKELLLGNAAIARGAYEAGVKVSSAYPGTPSTEVSEYLVQYKDQIYEEWAPNEKVAAEVAIGASISGKRAMCVQKHVGLNVAADPLYSASYSGVNGGLVFVVADDPGQFSSQNEQDTRRVARAAKVPLLEPSDSQEAKDYMKYALQISEEYDRPVILRITTRLAHSQGLVELEDPIELAEREYKQDISKYVLVPANARGRHKAIEELNAQLALDCNEMTIYINNIISERDEKHEKNMSASTHECTPTNRCNLTTKYTLPYKIKQDSDHWNMIQNIGLNKVEYLDLSIGIITSGIPYQYVKEALPNASILKLGMVNPLPKKLIETFAEQVEKLYIIEELEPVIEEQVKSWGIECEGKELFSVRGEYSATRIREHILGVKVESVEPVQVPNRPPILCAGCPHRSIYHVMKQLKLHGLGDIGCYSLGAAPPLSVMETCICMGSSISTLHGMEKANGKEYIKEWMALIGDSTFLHTGINSLMNVVYNRGNSTTLILDNSTTGMTGHQDHLSTGLTLQGEEAYEVNLEALCRAVGVRYVSVVDAFDMDGLKKAMKEETQREEASVIIARSPCVLLRKAAKYRPLLEGRKKLEVDSEQCRKCYLCLRPGCPAISKQAEGYVGINESMCNRCGLCASICNFDVIG